MKAILLAVVITYNTLCFSQQITVLAQSNTLLKPQHQEFMYLCDSTATTNATFVAQIKASGSLKNASNLYYFIKNKAQEMGANAFRLDQFNKLDNNSGELILSTYYAAADLFAINNTFLPHNDLFLFGYDDLTSHKTQGYKINGSKQQLGAGEFVTYSLGEGRTYKINKGGFTGMTYWINGNSTGDCTFLSFSGIGLNGADYAMYSNGIGVSINTGKINNVDPSLALLLLKIYQERK
jgi:hypothetical protein